MVKCHHDNASPASHDQGHLHPLHLDPPGLGALIEDRLHLKGDRLTVRRDVTQGYRP